jgi:hypothetical protein
MACIGNSAATSVRKSHSEPTEARSRRMRRRSSSSSPRTAAGVSPLVTSLRIRACLGSSIMFSTMPATGRS